MTPRTHKQWKVIASTATALAFAATSAPTAFAQAGNADSNNFNTPPASAQALDRTGAQVSLDPGTVIPVLLNTELTSNNSQEGDTFTARVDTSRDAYNTLMQGATLDGVVSHAVPQSGSDPGTLELAFTRLRLPGGESYPISGTVTSLDAKDLQVKGDGTLQAVKTNKDQSLTYAGVGAGAGALISLLSGGKLRIEDLLLGGGLGYAAGQLLKGTQQVHDVDLKPGTPVGVLLGQTVRYHRIAPARIAPVTTSEPAYPPRTVQRARLKYYSYLGHPYSMDLNTGRRTRLD